MNHIIEDHTVASLIVQAQKHIDAARATSVDLLQQFHFHTAQRALDYAMDYLNHSG